MDTNPENSIKANSIYREMPDHVFTKLSKLIYDESGIKLGVNKKIMLTSRLNKRLKALGITKYNDYYEYIFNSNSNRDELHRMIDAVSTNKTEFFREDAHFDFLIKEALPAVTKFPGFVNNGVINIWSAGCSSGEEPYTIALMCAEYFGGCSGKFRVLATDISNKVLDIANSAIYQDNVIKSVPFAMKRKYFMLGKGNKSGYHKIVPELREKVIIQRLNLVNDNFRNIPMMDLIFCRNVVIYFDRETQNRLHRKLLDHIKTGGYLFIGHSETLNISWKDIQRIAPTIYRKLE
jgi:chemotaxis protein methyltransferase CheR